ncbi:CG32751, partial [Drosophila busckii]
EQNFYTAGVVEFRQAEGNELLVWQENLAGYLEIIHSTNASATDIIIFPEATLNTIETASFVPAPEQQITPCLDDAQSLVYAEFLVKLSCAARETRKYIVINLSEQQLCSDTPEDTRPCASTGYNIFNTNVVFDRQGAVISRYRKVHLYGEMRNSTFKPETVAFDTDFNVTFGHFICFDIMFEQPTLQLLQQGVKDFVYPSMWFSQLPLLTSVQAQLSWAYANDVNLLAAGASMPKWGSTGTGIFHGRQGTIVSKMVTDAGERRIYVAQVPKYGPDNASQPPVDELELLPRDSASGLLLIKRDELENYKSVRLEQLLPPSSGVSSGLLQHQLCHGFICCNFKLHWRRRQAADETNFSYRLGAFDGWREEQHIDDANYVRNCAIFACTGTSIEQCGLMPDLEQQQAAFSFDNLTIEANYVKSSALLLMPNTLLADLYPLEPADFDWSLRELNNSHAIAARLTLTSPAPHNLLTFAIYGNYFDDVCTYHPNGTTEQNLQCGFKPLDD